MKNKYLIKGLVCLALVMPVHNEKATAQMSPAGLIKAGAAKVNITPGKEEMPSNFTGVLDSIYCRSIVIDNGITRAALITVDIGALREDSWNEITQRIDKELGIPAGNILLTATHSHSTPFGIWESAADKIYSSVKLAGERLQPAQVSYGTGVSYINVNRNIIDPVTRRWWEGANYEGPSDKTVAVITFETSDGEPFAVYYNYGVHGVISGVLDMVSGDIPGNTSRYIEESFDNKIVAVWSTGANGDQNPLYYQQTYDLRDIRIKDYASRGIDISNSMPSGGTGMDRSNPEVARLMEEQKQMLLSTGQFLGEEVKRVMRNSERTQTTMTISSGQGTVTCAGRKRLDEGRAGYPGVYEDADSVKLKIGLLMLGDIAVAYTNGEPFTLIAQELKSESPYAATMMVELTNGFFSYIPNDAAYSYYTFEVVSSTLKPGCAERGIIDGVLELMEELK